MPNTSTGLPVFISNANNISSVEFTIQYNPELLTISGGTTPISGAAVSINTSNPGLAIIQVSSPNSFSLVDGAATILNLIASVPATAPYASKGIIGFGSMVVRDTNLNVVPSVADNAVHVAAFFGDLNADQGYDSADTILVQRLGLETNSGKTAFQTLDPYVIGDALNDHSIDSSDTIAVQKLGVGHIVPEVATLPAEANTKVILGADPQLSIGVVTASSAAANTNVFVPINLLVTEASGITLSGMDFAVSFDSSRFQVNVGGVSIASSTQNGLIWETDTNGVPNPNLVGGAFSLATNIDNVAGTVRIQVSSANGTTTLPMGTDGTLLQLRFTTKAGAASGLSVINLLANEGATNTRLRDNNLVALTLLPVPTNGGNDLVDGSITIPAANAAPTGLSLSPTALLENAGANATVGTFATTDPNVGDTFTYTLVSGAGSTDNAAFNVSGNSLHANGSFDFETKSSYTVRVRTTDQGGLFFENTFAIAVTNVNEPVVLTRVNASVFGNVFTQITNSGTWADAELGSVTLSASLGVVTKNLDGTWNWSHQPTGQLVGQTVTISATDGTNVSATTFELTAFTTIATRGLVYVGATGVSASTSLATDKSALLPGQSSTFTNYTNYSRGLNGIVIDLVGLSASTTNSQMAASLQFANWDGIAATGFVGLPGAAVPTVTVLPGVGAGGSARVRVTFPNNTVQNTWLRVTVLANATSGLAANDVFYFGNVIGELDVDNSATRLSVTVQDVNLMLANQSPVPNSANANNKFDLDRNGRVNGQDAAILRASLQVGGIVAPITAPSPRPLPLQREISALQTIGSVAVPLPTQSSSSQIRPIESSIDSRVVEDLPVRTGISADVSNQTTLASDAGPSKVNDAADWSNILTDTAKKKEQRSLSNVDSLFASQWASF